MDLLPIEGIDWSRVEITRRVWLEDIGGDHAARLEFLAGQGLHLVMADLSPDAGETLHFSNPRDNETLHLRAGGGKSLLTEAAKYFPAASRWIEMLQGADRGRSMRAAPAHSLVRRGLVLEVEGGYIRRVCEAWREYPQGVLYGVKAGDASFHLEREMGGTGMALSLSFLLALEDARGMKVPEAAMAVRAALLELARARAHLEWIASAASLLGRRRISAGCAGLCAELETAVEEWLGDPPGRGWVVAGGVREDFPREESASVAQTVTGAADTWERLSRRAASLPVPGWVEKRLRALRAEAGGCAWVGPMARAAGMERDVRKEEPGIYDVVGWESASPPEGAGILRRLLAIRAGEIASSLDIARRVLAALPDTPLLVKRGRGGRGEGFGRCEGPDGEVCCHLALVKGRVSFAAFSLPHEINRSAARVLEGCRLDEADLVSLAWERRPHA